MAVKQILEHQFIDVIRTPAVFSLIILCKSNVQQFCVVSFRRSIVQKSRDYDANCRAPAASAQGALYTFLKEHCRLRLQRLRVKSY